MRERRINHFALLTFYRKHYINFYQYSIKFHILEISRTLRRYGKTVRSTFSKEVSITHKSFCTHKNFCRHLLYRHKKIRFVRESGATALSLFRIECVRPSFLLKIESVKVCLPLGPTLIHFHSGENR